MPPNRGYRGGGRGRGGFKQNNSRQTPQDLKRPSVKDRLGSIPTYGKHNNKQFKYVKNVSSVADIPQETEVRETSKNFVKAYYSIFDSPGRTNLESLYSSEAIFSFSSTYPLHFSPFPLGRNLLEVREPEQRSSLLLFGKTNIARDFGNFFPKTEHPVNQLLCDVPFYIVNPMYIASMQIIVTGVYNDLSQEKNSLVAFTRVFVIKQVSVDGDGKPVYQIFNELFMLQTPTPGQIKNYHNYLQLANKASGAQRQNVSAEDTSSKLQEEMIRSIMAKTKMNRTASENLLKESNWVEQAALSAFNTVYERDGIGGANGIPQECFT